MKDRLSLARPRTLQALLVLISLVAVAPAGAGPAGDAAAAPPARRSRAPRPWRPDQVQRLSPTRAPLAADPALLEGARRIVMAGSSAVAPPDDPGLRIDANEPGSPFAGVCSLLVQRPGGNFICSGAAISPRHVLTAGHCFDGNDDGQVDFGTEVTVIFNVEGAGSHTITPDGILSIEIHPDYTGFSTPALNDDLALVTLAEPLAEIIPVYPPFRGELAEGEIVTLVGYGQSGFGDVGITVDANLQVKRTGGNAAEQFFQDDESGEAFEVWRADFDGAHSQLSCFGGLTLGNDIETSVAPGDSGGPALVNIDGAWQVWGVNTYIGDCNGAAPLFGSTCGGIVVNGYLPWIDLVVECAGNCADCNGNGIADGLDVRDGTSVDEDGNNIPDECVMGPGDLWVANSNEHIGYSFGAGGIVASQGGISAVRVFRYGPDGLIYAPARQGLFSPFQVYRLDPVTGAVLDLFISGADGVANPVDVLFGSDGLLYVLNSGASTAAPAFITRHDPGTGDLVDIFVMDDPDTPELENGGLTQARSMTFGPDGNLYVTDLSGLAVARFDGATGEYLGPFADDFPGAGGNATLAFRDGLLWVGRISTGDIVRFDAATGEYVDTFLDLEQGLVMDFEWDPAGLLYVLVNAPPVRIDRYDPVTGDLLDTFLEQPPLNGSSVLGFAADITPPPADVNGDGVVDVDDLVAVLLAWGDCPPGPCPADLDGDGAVNVTDLILVIVGWEP